MWLVVIFCGVHLLGVVAAAVVVVDTFGLPHKSAITFISPLACPARTALCSMEELYTTAQRICNEPLTPRCPPAPARGPKTILITGANRCDRIGFPSFLLRLPVLTLFV